MTTENQRRDSERSTISVWERRNGRGQSPTLLLEALRRVHRDPGGGRCSEARPTSILHT